MNTNKVPIEKIEGTDELVNMCNRALDDFYAGETSVMADKVLDDGKKLCLAIEKLKYAKWLLSDTVFHEEMNKHVSSENTNLFIKLLKDRKKSLEDRITIINGTINAVVCAIEQLEKP